MNNNSIRACVFSFVFVHTLGTNLAWGAPDDLPGLSIARLALPSLSQKMSTPAPTGTPIGEKTIELKTSLIELAGNAGSRIQSTRTLYESAISEVNAYHLIVGEIEAKLQIGTTPSNPNLVIKQEQANIKLQQIADIIHRMENVATDFSQTSQEAESLVAQVKETLTLPGALDEDHANLLLMAEELEKFKTSILQIRDILNGNALRQNEWLTLEGAHFSILAASITRGKSQVLPMGQAPTYPIPIAVPEVSHSLKAEILQDKKKTARKPVKLVQRPEPQEPRPKKTQDQIIVDVLQEPLPVVTIAPSVIHPVVEEEPQVLEPLQKVSTLSESINNRQPLGILNPGQQPDFQRWYLYAAAQRGLKTPTSLIEIVTVVRDGISSERGEAVKSVLITMGIPSTQLSVVTVKGTEDQPENVYLFQKNR